MDSGGVLELKMMFRVDVANDVLKRTNDVAKAK